MITHKFQRGLLSGILLLATCARAQQELKAHVELTRAGHTLKDASQTVIWLTPIGSTFDPPRQDPAHIPQLVQKNKSFHPSLVVIPAGGKVEFPNHDPFFHNVFSLFEGKRFDLGLYEAGSTRTVLFDKPGVSYIFCNIHAEMSAVVIALATPYYGVSNQRGLVTIPNVPPGRYSLHVWYETALPEALNSTTRDVKIAGDNSFLGTFKIPVAALPLQHKNKYGRDYEPPAPDNPAYQHP